ncbi:hypothetical protein TNCV_4227241 [Trichonephila clavipes]|nr:hypothetical protein TNCV_4227241 [Trichonephila clavipes]
MYRVNSSLAQNRKGYANSKTVSFGSRVRDLKPIKPGDLYARMPMVCMSWTARHHAAKENEYVLHFDGDTRLLLVWLEKGTRNNPLFVQERSHS